MKEAFVVICTSIGIFRPNQKKKKKSVNEAKVERNEYID